MADERKRKSREKKADQEAARRSASLQQAQAQRRLRHFQNGGGSRSWYNGTDLSADARPDNGKRGDIQTEPANRDEVQSMGLHFPDFPALGNPDHLKDYGDGNRWYEPPGFSGADHPGHPNYMPVVVCCDDPSYDMFR